MFRYPAKTLKIFSIILFFIELIALVIVVSLEIFYDDAFLGIVIILGGSLILYFITLLLCGFCELIENSARNNEINREIEKAIRTSLYASAQHTFSSQTNVQPSSTEKTSSSTNIKSLKQDSVHPIPSSSMTIICPHCGTSQVANRNVCWKCGVKFD